MSFIVGLTGKTCSGKNRAAEILCQKGWDSVDADKVGHDVLFTCRKQVEESFGPVVMNPDGSVNRKILGPIVFSDTDKLRLLESITGPAINAECLRLANESAAPVFIINAALLSRGGLHEICDAVIFVKADRRIREKRALLRDGLTVEQFRDRDASQRDVNEKNLGKNRPVLCITNNGSEADFIRQIDGVYATINKIMQQ